MTTISPSEIARLGDRELLETTKRLAAIERSCTVDVIGALAEVESRKLHLRDGYSSMFDYCTRALHFSEHAAYGRIEASRLARRFPLILELLCDGSITLTTIGLLAPHLTEANHIDLLSIAKHKSKRKVEELVARRYPRPDVAASVRKLAAADRPDTEAPLEITPAVISVPPTAPSQKPAIITPLAPERYSVRLTISRAAHEHLRRAQDLLRHAIPSGDPAAVIERALARLVEDLERRKLAMVRSPRSVNSTGSQGRHVPAAVKREVWARDGGQCAFVGTDGRCQARGFLELHHAIPFADGGETTAANLQLRCRAHNAYEAEQWFELTAIDQSPGQV